MSGDWTTIGLQSYLEGREGWTLFRGTRRPYLCRRARESFQYYGLIITRMRWIFLLH
jgi:hypothetical protein